MTLHDSETLFTLLDRIGDMLEMISNSLDRLNDTLDRQQADKQDAETKKSRPV